MNSHSVNNYNALSLYLHVQPYILSVDHLEVFLQVNMHNELHNIAAFH